MRSLLPPGDDVDDLHSVYATHWLPDGGLRANFVASIDGAISVSGLSGGLQTPGDNKVFAALRDLSDVVLVGSGTAQAEGYRPVRLSPERAQRRLTVGLPDALRIAVVSGTLRVDPDAKLFADPSTIVLTTDRADPDVRAALAAEVVVCGADQLDLNLAVNVLHARGLTRILCEGGPSLFASVAAAGLLDELCLSVSPILAGPGSGRLSAGPEWASAQPMDLVALLEEDGALFHRYRREPV